MDTLSVIALIIIALVILAVIIAFRQKVSLTLKGLGFDLGLSGENAAPRPPARPAAPPPAGVRAEKLESTAGDIVIEEGTAHNPSGIGIDARDLKAKKDILIGKGESGDPKAPPPA
ncbi:MAG: hypothetical protein L6R45_27655 [Anaerolineae bacterium]|nr:hypothetical protein [Anaerolineae bacterium]